MKHRFFWVIITIVYMSGAYGQKSSAVDSACIIALNQRVDSLVTKQNIPALHALYADDFVFSHGTGLIEGKTGWLNTVRQTVYPRRTHDSLTAEIHPDIAILKGKLYIERIDQDKTTAYQLRYIRVYGLRNKAWQLVSHITTEEKDEK